MSPPAPAVASAEAAQINDRCDREPQEIDARHRQGAIYQPCVDQRCQGKEDEAKDQQKNAVKYSIQIVREEEQQQQAQAREGQDHDQQ